MLYKSDHDQDGRYRSRHWIIGIVQIFVNGDGKRDLVGPIPNGQALRPWQGGRRGILYVLVRSGDGSEAGITPVHFRLLQ